MKKTSISLIVTCLAMATSSLFAQTGGGSGSSGTGEGPSSAGPSTPATPAIPGSTSTDPGQSGIGSSVSGVASRDLKDNPRVSTSGSVSAVSPNSSTTNSGLNGSVTNSMSGGNSRTGVLTGIDTARTGLGGPGTRGQEGTTVPANGSVSTISTSASRPLNSSDDWKSGANAGIPTPTGTAGLGTNSINSSSGIVGLTGTNVTTKSGATNGNINSSGVASGVVNSGAPITEASGAARESGSVGGLIPASGSKGTSGAGK